MWGAVIVKVDIMQFYMALETTTTLFKGHHFCDTTITIVSQYHCGPGVLDHLSESCLFSFLAKTTFILARVNRAEGSENYRDHSTLGGEHPLRSLASTNGKVSPLKNYDSHLCSRIWLIKQGSISILMFGSTLPNISLPVGIILDESQNLYASRSSSST